MVQIRFKPRTTWPEGEGPAGFTTKVEIQHYNFFEAVARAANQVWIVLRDTVSTLVRTIVGSGSKFRIVGPVGLKQASDWTIEQARHWSAPYPVLYLAGLINVGLGFTNLLPIPALDGGRIVFVVYELLTRRRFPYRIERSIQAAGAIGIILGMILLSIMDLKNPLF
jgi:regulator of sigma E protease